MFYRTIFVCLVGFVLVKLVKMDPMEITFEIKAEKTNIYNTLTCDHSDDKKLQNKYTVHEGQDLNITTNYTHIINHFMCQDHHEKIDFTYKNTKKKNVTTFKVEKRMGNLWKCKILAHQNNNVFRPMIQYKNDTYAVAYCFMKIHVRQIEAPQTILVNNMVLQPVVRRSLSDKVVDFTAEYQYVNGDVVEVTCANFLNEEPVLTMEYDIAGSISDNSTMKDLKSSKAIGFSTKMHSAHNNSYMMCTYTGTNDYTKVMVRFIMRTEFNIVSIKINGKNLRPNLTNAKNNYYRIEYKYRSYQPINVLCEIERREDVKIVITGDSYKAKKYHKTDLILNKKTNMNFYLDPKVEMKLACSADYLKRRSAEQVGIYFTEGNFPIVSEKYPLDMKFLSNGTVMKLYSDYKLKIIFYEFEDEETLNLTCGTLKLKVPGPLLYLELEDSVCRTNDCIVSKTMRVTRKHENTEIVCYLKEEPDRSKGDEVSIVHSEIRVILRERVLPTTTTTTTSTTSTPKTPPAPEYTVSRISSTTSSTTTVTSESLKGPAEELTGLGWKILAVIGSIACIVIICVSIVIIKLRKRNHSQRGPHNRNYENLGEPSEASIPAHPPQWENHYAVPVDRRTDDTTYSVPCQPAELYATPTPKNLRNKKVKPVDPTYAVLAVPKGRGQKNNFKETEDPNYSEVYANRKEECYAKVLPKSVRNKMEQENPYSYVTNEPPYVNTEDPEPMYCEPAKAQGGQYANLNSSHYANTNAPEYVEPTYCEPQKRMK